MIKWLAILAILISPVILKNSRDGVMIYDSRIDSVLKKIDRLKISYLTVTNVEFVPAGSFKIGTDATFNDLPAFCRIAATLRPVKGSEIKIELWLPEQNWNYRFLGTGNGGGARSIAYGSLAGGIKKGYATVNTDMGTSRGGANGAMGQPEVWADFGYRATHLMTVVGKAIVNAYYGKALQYAYFNGCSTGGQQALMEAQRYSDDYDGIIAGAPANNRTHLHSYFLHNYQLANIEGKPLFSKTELSYISRRIVNAYALKSGSAPGDNFLTDPGLVSVNFDSLFRCKPYGTDSCLSDRQLAALKKIYAGPVNPRMHEQIYTPPPFGSENVSGGLMYHETDAVISGLFYPLKWALGNAFDPRKFDFDKDIERLDSVLATALNANDPNLSTFKRSGGKMIMYSGTADPLVPYQDAVHYYQRVIKQQNGIKETQEFFRYYLIPGMAHCKGGPGLNAFSKDILTELVNWVEAGTAPDKLEVVAFDCCIVNAPPRLRRPVFPYPKFPRYISGDIRLPGSYTYTEHKGSQMKQPAVKYLR